MRYIDTKYDWDNQSAPVTATNLDSEYESQHEVVYPLGISGQSQLSGNMSGTGSYAEKAFRLLEWAASKGIIIVDQNKIAGFLISNLDLHGSILFICDKALKALPPTTKIFVTLESDPEYEKNQLVFIARTKVYDHDFMEQIQKIRTELKSDLKGKRGRVFLTTDYQTM